MLFSCYNGCMELKENITGQKAIYKTEANIEIKDGYLEVNFISHHPSMNSYSNKYNDCIYNADVVEIFLSTKEDKKYYYEIEVAPNNTVFLSEIYNDGKSFSGSLIDECFIKTSSKEENGKWLVNILIPLDKVGYDPKRGIEYNLYRIDTDGEKPNKHLFSLNPTMCGSFHKRNSFVKL